MPFEVYLFDAYGTLFDVHSAVEAHAEAVGPNAERLSAVWRDKQLEYSWVRALTGAYRDFWDLTGEALDFAFAVVPDTDPSTRDALLTAYQTLRPYDEVGEVLEDLRQSGAKIAILSNGSPDMLEAAVAAADFEPMFDALLSVDTLRTFKTDINVYAMAADHFRCPPGSVSFQSSNRWDIAGATRYGFHTVWINRSGAPDEYRDLPPKRVLSSLQGLMQPSEAAVET